MNYQINIEELKADGWTLTTEQMPPIDKAVDVLMVSGLGKYQTRAQLDIGSQWVDCATGYTIYSDVIAWHEDSGGTDEILNHPFQPFKQGDEKACIGYWHTSYKDAEFQVLATLSNHDSTYSDEVFYSVVMGVVTVLKRNYHSNLDLNIYCRHEATESLDVE